MTTIQNIPRPDYSSSSLVTGEPQIRAYFATLAAQITPGQTIFSRTHQGTVAIEEQVERHLTNDQSSSWHPLLTLWSYFVPKETESWANKLGISLTPRKVGRFQQIASVLNVLPTGETFLELEAIRLMAIYRVLFTAAVRQVKDTIDPKFLVSKAPKDWEDNGLTPWNLTLHKLDSIAKWLRDTGPTGPFPELDDTRNYLLNSGDLRFIRTLREQEAPIGRSSSPRRDLADYLPSLDGVNYADWIAFAAKINRIREKITKSLGEIDTTFRSLTFEEIKSLVTFLRTATAEEALTTWI